MEVEVAAPLRRRGKATREGEGKAAQEEVETPLIIALPLTQRLLSMSAAVVDSALPVCQRIRGGAVRTVSPTLPPVQCVGRLSRFL